MLQEEFINKFTGRVKKGMLKKFFFYDRTLNYIEVPIFTEFSTRKQITPMRNTQCLKPTCIYDIEELFTRYQKGNYSSYVNFMCHTCRKIIDLQNFYLDENLRSIIDSIWNTYNKFSVQCSKAAIFKDGSWEAVIPEYIRRMYRQNVEDYEKGRKEDDDIIDDEPDEIIRYELPLLHEFDVEEYVELLEQEDEGEIKHHDSDILLRRYNLQIKWGEFMQFKNQVAVSSSLMGIYIHYLHEYLEERRLNLKLQSKLKIGMLCIKVTSFDRFRRIAEFHYISDNLEGPKANYSEYEQVLIVINYDERWIALICDIEDKKLKIIDFLEDAIARTTLDEVYELGQYLIEQIYQPYKFPKNPPKDMLIGQIQEQMRNEIPRKLQIYCDCGHKIGQYLYYYILEEIELMKMTKEWPQDVGLKQKIHNVKFKIGEQDYYTTKICWVILKMSNDTGFKIKVYDMKPKEQISSDALDDFVIEQARQQAQKLWDNDTQKKQATILVARGLNNYEEMVIKSKDDIKGKDTKNDQKFQKRVEKYWGVESGVQFNNQIRPNNEFKQQQHQKDHSILSNLSFQFGNQEQPRVYNQSDYSRDNSKTVQEIVGQISKRNQEVKKQKEVEKPFLVMPKAQLQQYLTDYKQQIINEYKQQALIKGFKQNVPGQFNQTMQSKNQSQNVKLSESQYERLLLNLDRTLNQSEQKELKQLQQELGMNDSELANLDGNQFNQLLQRQG